jgi:hypothetical protein
MLAGNVTRCGIYAVDYGLDHIAVDIVIDLIPDRYL